MVQPRFSGGKRIGNQQNANPFQIKSPAQIRREREERRRRIEQMRAMESATSVLGSQQGVQDTVLGENLEPELNAVPGAPETGGRKSFFDRLQSFGEASAGTVFQTAVDLLPGEQGTFEKNLKEVMAEMGTASNPWQRARQQGMINAEAWRRTKMPSFKLDVTPGFGPLNLPGDRTLDKVDIGVKGALEIIADPTNLIPLGGTAKVATQLGAKGLRAAGLSVVNEAIASGTRAGLESVQAAKNVYRPKVWREDLDIPDTGAEAARKETQEKIASGIDEAENALVSASNDLEDAHYAQRNFVPDEPLTDSPDEILRVKEINRAEIKRLEKNVNDAEKAKAEASAKLLSAKNEVPEVHIRPRTQEAAETAIEKANTEIPEFIKSFRDSRFMQALPPLRWAFTKINPIAFIPTASDPLARKQAAALFAHQRRQASETNNVMHSLTQLANIKGFSGEKQGLIKSKNYNGVFEIEPDSGNILNLAKADRGIYRVTPEEIAQASRNEFKLNQYAVFENAFDPEYGLDFSKKFDGQLITELPEERVAELIASGKVNGEFVDQAYAIKAVGDWVKDATRMMQKRGVDIKEVYDDDSPLQYIFRQAVEKQGKPLPGKGKAAGSAQDFAKDRTYLGEKILDSLDNNVVYRDNFQVGATHFMESVYTAIRDVDLRNSLTATGVKLREELLEAPSANLKAATADLNESLAVKRYLKDLKGKSLTKPQLAVIDRVGANLGFDSATLRAEEIISQQRKALTKTAETAASYAKETREMATLITKLSNRSLAGMLVAFGWGGDGALTDLGTTFRQRFPELANALNQLKGFDTRIKQNLPTQTLRKNLPVDVPVGTRQRAATETTEFLGTRRTTSALNSPAVNYTQTVQGVHRQLDKIKRTGAKGRKNFLPREDMGITVSSTGKKYVIKNVKRADGRSTNTWDVYRAEDLDAGVKINREPLTHGDELPTLGNFKPEGATDEIASAIAADSAGRAGLLSGFPGYIETAGDAQQIRRRTIRNIFPGDPKAVKAFEAARKKLAAAIQADAKNISDNAAKASAEVQKFIGGGKVGFGKGQRVWLRNNYPHVADELEAAAALNPGKAKREAIAKAQRTIAQAIKDQKELQKVAKNDLKKAKSNLVGAVDVTEESFQKRFYGTHLKTGKLNPDTGLHEIEVLTGVKYRDLVKDGGKSLVLKEASQKHLPFLKGVFFREDDVKRIEKSLLLPEAKDTWSTVESFFLRTVPAAGDLARVLKAGFDFGAPFLQGIPLLARRPDIWAKATARHYKVFGSSRGFHQAYLQNNVDVIREMAVLDIPLGAGATDYFNALHSGGAVDQIGGFLGKTLRLDAAEKGSNRVAAKLASSTKDAGRKFQAAGKRFEESFEAFNDYAKIEMFKALRATAAKQGDAGMEDLAAFIRNMTGALNTGSLGASGRQQAFERGWLFFSPRYTRASLALMADAFQGGLRGQQARQTFVQMAGGGAVAYMAFAEALGQPIKLDPRPKSEGGDGAEFMTVKIAGQNVGIGSFWTSMIRMIANTATTAVEDPRLLLAPNTRDNPIARWVRSRSAPSTGFSLDGINGANFLGESIEGFGGWATHIGRQTLPFAIENAVFEDGPIFGRLAAGLPAEMLGGRTFPVSAIEYRNLERERAAQATYKKSWEELNGLQRAKLENDPEGELGELTQIVRDEATKMQPADPGSAEAAISNYFDSKQAAEETWRKKIREGVHLFEDSNVIDTVAFKERYLEPANARRRTEIGIATEDPSYREVEKYFAELTKDSPLNPEDEAFGEYIQTVVAADFSDPVIGFDFRRQDEAKREFTSKYGEEMFEYVQARFRAARESYDFQFPALIDELYIGRDRFEYYWRDTEEEVLNRIDNSEYVRDMHEKYIRSTDTNRSLMRENLPELDAFLRILEKTRRLLRENNAELDIFLYRWGFADTLAHEANKVVHDSDPYYFRHHPATSFPYPVEES